MFFNVKCRRWKFQRSRRSVSILKPEKSTVSNHEEYTKYGKKVKKSASLEMLPYLNEDEDHWTFNQMLFTRNACFVCLLVIVYLINLSYLTFKFI